MRTQLRAIATVVLLVDLLVGCGTTDDSGVDSGSPGDGGQMDATLTSVASDGGNDDGETQSTVFDAGDDADGATLGDGDHDAGGQDDAADGNFALFEGDAGANCFASRNNAAIPFVFMQECPPPPVIDGSYDPDYICAPGNGFVTAQVDTTNPALDGSAPFVDGYFLWGNRCIQMDGYSPDGGCPNDTIVKANAYSNIVSTHATDAGDTQLRPAFTTVARADECTLIQTKWILGTSSLADLSTAATSAGLTLWTDANHADLLTSSAHKTGVSVGKTGGNEYLVDLCILEATPEAARASLLVIDWEVQDFHTPAQTLALFQSLKAEMSGSARDLYIFTNDLVNAAEKNGFSQSLLSQVFATVDALMPVISSQATPGEASTDLPPHARTESFVDDYQAQLAWMTGDGGMPLTTTERAHLVLSTSLYDLHVDEAAALRSAVLSQAYRGFLIWRNGESVGGTCLRTNDAGLQPNQALACLAFGVCDGGFL